MHYLIFTDEAGAYKAQTTPDFRKRHPFYVRSNVIISMDDYMEFQKEMQTLNGMYEIPVGEEIKWSDLWEKLRNRPRTPAIAAITEDRLKGYYRKVFECASQKDSLQYIFTITNVYEQYCLLEERHVYKFHLQEAFQRVQMDLRPRNEFAVFIMDELNTETIKQIKAVCHEFTVNGDFIRNYGNVYHSIFYSNSRLKLHLENDQMYHLTVNGKDVFPDKISCGERNALALCYFFSEIAKETELQKLYHDEMFVVIDDPVSSFDVENRVGILSFLRYKLNQMLSACATTKVLMMSHDVSVIFDLQKVMDEVSANCAEVGKHAEYCSFQLVNKRIVPFKAKSHNEYTRLMKCVYEYGRNPEPTAELTIGNMTRRVLEAFSTFTFKEGPDKVSLNPQVLALIPDQNKRAYFQNSMYRLVLNTESHLQEAVQGAPEMSFFSHLTVEEKQRTARDVLCFMYCVNPAHVLAHLPNARKELDNWMASIG